MERRSSSSFVSSSIRYLQHIRTRQHLWKELLCGSFGWLHDLLISSTLNSFLFVSFKKISNLTRPVVFSSLFIYHLHDSVFIYLHRSECYWVYNHWGTKVHCWLIFLAPKSHTIIFVLLTVFYSQISKHSCGLADDFMA